MVPTMTLHECCELMRANKIKSSEPILGQMIEEGKFPFAVGVRRKEGAYSRGRSLAGRNAGHRVCRKGERMKWHVIAGIVSIIAGLMLGTALYLWIQVTRLAMAGVL